MKRIVNTSVQSWNIPFNTPTGVEIHSLSPRESVVVHDSWITDRVVNLVKRSQVSLSDA